MGISGSAFHCAADTEPHKPSLQHIPAAAPLPVTQADIGPFGERTLPVSQPRDTNARRADSQRTSLCEPLIPKTTSLYPMLAKQDHSSHCCKSLRGCAETVSHSLASNRRPQRTQLTNTHKPSCVEAREPNRNAAGTKPGRSLCRDPDSTRHFTQRSSFLFIKEISTLYLSQLSLSNINI